MNILVSYNWLKHYAAIKDSPEDLARKLSLSGPSVEKINHIKPQFGNVVVGEILEIKKHPNADKLSIAKVDVGEQKPRQIIFGQMAKIEVGFKTSIALAPTTLPGNKEIKKAEIRGILSEGMLCLDQELGILNEGVSITFFDKNVKNGTPVAKTLDLEDWIFDAEITTNHPDALGMVGFAREVSAITGAKFLWLDNARHKWLDDARHKWLDNARHKWLDDACHKGEDKTCHKVKEKTKTKSDFSLSVKIEDKSQCPRYMAAVIEGVKVADSPVWLKKRLIAAGLRPINNIVDVTNYVMLEFGQPLHAFDFDKIESVNSKSPLDFARGRQIPPPKKTTSIKSQTIQTKKIIVRRAKNGEEIETLDGVKRKLYSEILIIADREKPLAIAGVIGGVDSSVGAGAKNIIIEAANFNPKAVRKSSRALSLFSDSSNRFEKGLSAEFPRIALSRAIELICDLSGGRQSGKIIDACFKKYRPAKVGLGFSYLYQKLGVEISAKKVIKILESLGFKVAAKSKAGIKAIVPYWRQGDIEIPDDLVEEIARIYGYHNLPATLPKGDIPSRPCLPCLPAGRPDRQAAGDYFNNEERTKDFISDLGFCEVYSNSMVSEKMLENFGINPASALKIKNPLNEDMVYMRSTLIPSLLKIISKNLRHKKEAGIFEMANIYLLREGREKSRLPKEEMTLGLTISGPGDKAFGKLRAVSESLFKKLCIKEKDVVCAPAVRENLHPTRTAVIKIGGAEIGIVGELHPCLAGRQVATFKALDIGQRVAVAEISFEKLEAFASDKKIYTPVSKFPPVEMD
ncbi:phenylalanine--tRNA ligase subunit beta, partial [Candidatus Parcubacteria bacterium]|nr:phenylalanine--tRNA ligase subunit beta [Candidatus Parcubacteria bacterium]